MALGYYSLEKRRVLLFYFSFRFAESVFSFYNGGILFSSITFAFIAFISLYSFLLLVKAKFVVSGSFGDIGGRLYGPWMRYVILGSIVISQLGFVAAYTIFVAENLQSFVLGVTNCSQLIPVQYFILMELIVFLPLALVRDLTKLSSTALIADGFILLGLLYIFGSEISIIAKRGIADVKFFNPRDFPLFIGTAVFSFEGIGLVRSRHSTLVLLVNVERNAFRLFPLLTP